MNPISAFPLAWSDQLIANGRELGPLPVYGSAEWVELPEDDRRKVAATVLAAEAWRRGERPEWLPASIGRGRRLRELTEARRPRPGDHPGGPVQWDEVGQ